LRVYALGGYYTRRSFALLLGQVRRWPIQHDARSTFLGRGVDMVAANPGGQADIIDMQDEQQVRQAAGVAAQQLGRRGLGVVKSMTVDELLAKLAPAETMDQFAFEPKSDSKNIFEMRELDGRKLMVFNYNGHPFRVRQQAYTKLGQYCGIPGAFLEKTPLDIMLPVYNYYVQNHDGVLGFGVIGDRIQTFTRGPMNPVSNRLAIEIAADMMGGELQVSHVSSDMQRTTFSLLVKGQDTSSFARHGHDSLNMAIATGVTFDNSYTMLDPIAISAYVEKLICTNGATSIDHVFRYAHRDHAEGTEEWLRENIAAALAAANIELERVSELRKIEFDGHMSDALRSLFEEFNIPRKVRELISKRVIDQGSSNMGDLYDIITDIASNDPDVLIDPTISRRMMRIGGRMAANPAICGGCHRILR
jgi:hypothetical protein